MTNSLFREEVVNARFTRWLGAVSVAQPLSLWTLTASALFATSLMVGFLITGSYTRRATVVGELVPALGLATVTSPAVGVVTQVGFEEGRTVRTGQQLALISVSHTTPMEGDAAQAIEAQLRERSNGLRHDHEARLRLLSAQASGLEARLKNAHRELAQVNAEIDTRNQQLKIAERTLATLRQMREARHVSELQLRQQESDTLQAVSDLQNSQRQATAARRTISQLEQALLELPEQQAITDASLERDLAALEQERIETRARGALAITAPVDGVVATQMVKLGQAVQAGQPLFALLPGDGRLEAELLVPSRAIGFVEPGDTVLLRYQAYPYQKFGHQRGKVARISRSALRREETGAPSGEASYRVTVELDVQSVTAYGKLERLRPGMSLDADILGEQRRLIEWLLEPVYSLKGSLNST